MEYEVHHLREAEFMGLVDKRNVKAKEWVDNLIITPQSQHILSPHGQCTLNPHGQPIVSPQVAKYDDSNGGEEGDKEENKVGDSGEDSSEDSDFEEIGEEDDEEDNVVSLTDSDEMSGQETDVMEMVLSYKETTKDRFIHIATCKGESCKWRVHCSKLRDGVIWKMKSITGVYQNCPRLSVNKMATHPWIAKELLIDYKANPTLKVVAETYYRKACVISSQPHMHQSTEAVEIIGAKLHTLFWTACNAYTEHVHKQVMKAIKKVSVISYEEPVENWARYLFPPELKCLDNTTNFVEFFNGKIKKLKHKPIFLLSEEIRRKFMKTITHRVKPGVVVPRVKLLLVKAELSSIECVVTPIGIGIFKVLDGVTSFIMDQNVHHCDCMQYTRSNTLRCSKCNQYGHNSRSHRKGGVLDIRRGKDKIRKKNDTEQKRKMGRPRKDGQIHVATSSTQLSSHKQQTHSSSSQLSSAQLSSAQPLSTQPPSMKKQTRKQSQPQSTSKKQKTIQAHRSSCSCFVDPQLTLLLHLAKDLPTK
ncbi:hypothetical protein Cgig2_004611 [Carnegiea gigantea]|uniref:Transposase MuDR plant domain-containing protein n=1 Tax=Carnegiea gigantea TaxID=171969 RepID=A0A9Q1Q9X2_9CARY|nr:hypothetical protein Cgig2_004611 [Carnegiea gigantea]